MKIQALVALVATVPAFWLFTSFVIPAEPTDAYVPATGVVKAFDPETGPFGALLPAVEETP